MKIQNTGHEFTNCCFIIFNSGYSLYVDARKKETSSEMKIYHYLYPVFSGLLQTAYGVGGPLIGTYMYGDRFSGWKYIFSCHHVERTLAKQFFA